MSKQAEPVTLAGQPLGKVKASWLLFKEAWRFLRADTEMLFVPIITSILNLALFGLLVAAFVLSGGLNALSESQPGGVMDLLFVFCCYVIAAFTLALAQAAIIHTVYTRVHGGDATLQQSIKKAFSHWVQLLIWSLITSTVGVILQSISNRSEFIGKLIAAILGTGWAVLTYFVVPVMVVDGKKPFASIGHSAEIFKRTWGETFVSNISLGVTFLLAHLLLFFSAFGLGFVSITLQSPALMLLVIFAYVILVLALILVNTVLRGVLKTLLFVYASEGVVPPNFNRELLEKMLQRNNPSVVTPPPNTNLVS